MRLQEKFDIDHSWERKAKSGFEEPDVGTYNPVQKWSRRGFFRCCCFFVDVFAKNKSGEHVI